MRLALALAAVTNALLHYNGRGVMAVVIKQRYMARGVSVEVAKHRYLMIIQRPLQETRANRLMLAVTLARSSPSRYR